MAHLAEGGVGEVAVEYDGDVFVAADAVLDGFGIPGVLQPCDEPVNFHSHFIHCLGYSLEN